MHLFDAVDRLRGQRVHAWALLVALALFLPAAVVADGPDPDADVPEPRDVVLDDAARAPVPEYAPPPGAGTNTPAAPPETAPTPGAGAVIVPNGGAQGGAMAPLEVDPAGGAPVTTGAPPGASTNTDHVLAREFRTASPSDPVYSGPILGPGAGHRHPDATTHEPLAGPEPLPSDSLPFAVGQQADTEEFDDSARGGQMAQAPLLGADMDVEETEAPSDPEPAPQKVSTPTVESADGQAPQAPRLHDAAPQPDQPAPQAQAAHPTDSPYVAAAIAAAAVAIAWHLVTFFAPLLTARKKNPLAHDARRDLLKAVSDYPGQHLCQLADGAGMGKGQASHHLKILAAAGMVVRVKAGSFVCFFPDKETASAMAPAAGVLQSPRARQFLQRVALRPGRTIASAAEANGVPKGGFHYHANRLADAGLIRFTQRGPDRVVDITPEGRVAAHFLRGLDVDAGPTQARSMSAATTVN